VEGGRIVDTVAALDVEDFDTTSPAAVPDIPPPPLEDEEDFISSASSRRLWVDIRAFT
jgi:hypothetical protein